MDYEDLAPESEEEFEQRQQELLEDARNEKEQREAAQNEALREIAKGDDLTEYEVIQLGQLDMRVKAWVPGTATQPIHNAAQKADSLDDDAGMAEVSESMEAFLPALDELTVSSDYDRSFWRMYYEKFGPQGMIEAVNRVCGPAFDEMGEFADRDVDDDRRDAAQGFQPDE